MTPLCFQCQWPLWAMWATATLAMAVGLQLPTSERCRHPLTNTSRCVCMCCAAVAALPAHDVCKSTEYFRAHVTMQYVRTQVRHCHHDSCQWHHCMQNCTVLQRQLRYSIGWSAMSFRVVRAGIQTAVQAVQCRPQAPGCPSSKSAASQHMLLCNAVHIACSSISSSSSSTSCHDDMGRYQPVVAMHRQWFNAVSCSAAQDTRLHVADSGTVGASCGARLACYCSPHPPEPVRAVTAAWQAILLALSGGLCAVITGDCDGCGST